LLFLHILAEILLCKMNSGMKLKYFSGRDFLVFDVYGYFSGGLFYSLQSHLLVCFYEKRCSDLNSHITALWGSSEGKPKPESGLLSRHPQRFELWLDDGRWLRFQTPDSD
ncbi:hypothetical protein, partial [Desulfosporosinus nitroreducens]|uniref:hypothetical protein n=1 Tax=Desulfosporosinus nitroreducens TaxID=2018668 RepID=UPI00207CC2E9